MYKLVQEVLPLKVLLWRMEQKRFFNECDGIILSMYTNHMYYTIQLVVIL